MTGIVSPQTLVFLSTALLQGGIAQKGQLLIGAVVVLLFAAIALSFRLILPYYKLPDELADNKRALRHSLGGQTPRSLRIGSLEELWNRRDAVRELVAGDRDRASDDASVTISEAAGLVHTELLNSWSEKTESVPRLSLRFAEEAVALLILGVLATVSIETFQSVFSTGGGMDVAAALETAQESLHTFATTGLDALTAFPYAGLLWSLAFAYSMLLAEWVFFNPWVVIGLLIVLAVVVARLEQHVPEVAEFEIVTESRRSIALSVAGAGLLVWLAGVVPATLGSLVGVGRLGSIAGLAAAGVVLLGLAYFAVGILRYHVGQLSRAVDGASRLAIAGLFIRRAGLGLGALAAPLIPAYAVYILVTVRLPAIIGAFLDGSPGVQLLVLVSVVVAIGMALVQVRDVWPDVRLAVAESLSRRAVRTMAAEKVFPSLVFAFLVLVGTGMEMGVIMSVSVGLSAAILARVLGTNYLRLRDWVDNRESEPVTASRVVFDAYTLRTADEDNRPLYYVRVNGEAVAACDVDRVTDAALETAAELFEDGETEPRIESIHAENAMEFGIVDIEETRKKLRTQTRNIVKHADRSGDAAVDDVQETLSDEVPEPVWREWVDDKMENARLLVRGGEYEFVELSDRPSDY